MAFVSCLRNIPIAKENTEVSKSRFTVVSTQIKEFILVLLFINFCILHTNNCKPTFADPVLTYYMII